MLGGAAEETDGGNYKERKYGKNLGNRTETQWVCLSRSSPVRRDTLLVSESFACSTRQVSDNEMRFEGVERNDSV